MSALSLAIVLALASVALLSLPMTAVWRRRASRPGATAAADARALFRRAVLPIAVPVFVSAGMLAPAFLMHEPQRDDEWVGLTLVALAAAGAVRLALVVVRALGSVRAARAIVAEWNRHATPLPREPWGLPASRIDVDFPVVAVAGFFRPRVFVDRRVLEACSPSELAAVAAHERAHVRSRDNLRRLLVAACAGPSSVVAAAWRAAAERAADERAADSPRTAVDLADALVQVARLGSAPALPIAAVSTIHDGGSLEQRVHRLLTFSSGEHDREPATLSVALPTCALATVLMIWTPLPATLHAALELLVRHMP